VAARRVEIGQVRSVKPTRRELRVRPLPAAPGRLEDLKWAYLLLRDGIELRCRVERVQPEGREYVVTLAPGVTRDNVARAKGATVRMETDTAVTSSKGPYDMAELLGAEVFDQAGSLVGTLTDVYRTGASDVIEVTQGDGATLLLPAIDAVVTAVHLDQRRLIVGDIAPYAVEERKGNR